MDTDDTRITSERIDAVLRYLPILEDPAVAGRVTWRGGEETPDGALTVPYPEYPEDVFALFMELGRPWWQDTRYTGKPAGEWIRDESFVAAASLEQLRTMLTWCVRGERFCDGHWASLLAEGRMLPLLRRLAVLRRDMA